MQLGGRSSAWAERSIARGGTLSSRKITGERHETAAGGGEVPHQLVEETVAWDHRIGRDELRVHEDDAVRAALVLQREAGMSIFTDGEMRRDAWQTVFSEAVDGFEATYPVRDFVEPDGNRIKLQMHTKAIRGKLRNRLSGGLLIGAGIGLALPHRE